LIGSLKNGKGLTGKTVQIELSQDNNKEVVLMAVMSVEINENETRDLLLEKVEEHLKKFDAELVYWDSKELCRRTCMSWGTIQNTFFRDKRFKKFKIGQKWYFPARETRLFLLMWLQEQQRR
jgi:hypothetical protein